MKKFPVFFSETFFNWQEIAIDAIDSSPTGAFVSFGLKTASLGNISAYDTMID